ncbi:MAG TPA: 6-hydroxycyclohex-1-ene-1-carbonyl-CoA dehydrogenase [Vicinamibacteria bacterium]|nr:6-hydroxycyclohex-1-ene-1-carbonyl-CoA dehydrogenase [Vicinamibacteria bacterium]
MSIEAFAYALHEPRTPLRREGRRLAPPGLGEAIVEVEACGLCHTDLAFADGSVPPRHALPLTLGHEVVGTVAAVGPEARLRAGARVIVPAVLPCGRCAFCAAGRGNACPDQKMPGNDVDGGFATHLLVPAAPLVPLDGMPAGFDVRELSVVADAVSTAYQAVRRAGVEAGDAVFVVGAGGVGGFVTQIARAKGARVAACDVDRGRLDLVAAHGAERVVAIDGRGPAEVKKEMHALAREWGVPSLRFRVFECSGTTEGQAQAWALLARAATLVQVGFTPRPLELRLSNLMAFDATAHGTWGCPPEAYPEVLGLIFAGKVLLWPFVEHAPLSRVNDLLDDMAHHRLRSRMVLDPRH